MSKEDRRYIKGALGHYLAADLKTAAHLALMPLTTAHMVRAFFKRKGLSSHPERRHPEYRQRLTMMCLGNYWERSTKVDLMDHPDALEAALIFVSYGYAVDDYVDEGGGKDRGRISYRTIEQNMRAGNYSGEDMNWHFANTVLRGLKKKTGDMNVARSEAEKIFSEVTYLLRGGLERGEVFDPKNDPIYMRTIGNGPMRDLTFEEAIAYRDGCSGQMGRVIADIMSIMSGVSPEVAEKARKNLGTVTLIGQLMDDWWDLPDEIDDSRNMLSHIVKKYPDELQKIKELPQFLDRVLIPFSILKKIAPSTVSDYFELYKHIAGNAADPFVGKDMMNMWFHLIPNTRNKPQKWVNYGITGASSETST